MTGTDGKIKYLCILDFEATCIQSPEVQDPQEVIEFPGVLVKITADRQCSIQSEFQRYVKPAVHPKLSPFCTELTGITQETIDNQGVDFLTAITEHGEWINKETGEDSEILVVTCGDWDLKTMLPAQLKLTQLPVPPHLRRYCNIKFLFGKKYTNKAAQGMTVMLDYLNIPLTGHHHSGIDDCRNIAKIAMKMVEDGVEFVPTAEFRLKTNEETWNVEDVEFKRLKF